MNDKELAQRLVKLAKSLMAADPKPNTLYMSKNGKVCATIKGGSTTTIFYLFSNGEMGEISLLKDDAEYRKILDYKNIADGVYDLLG